MTQSFDVFFDLRLNKHLCKQTWGWWFKTPSRLLWRHCIELVSSPHREPVLRKVHECQHCVKSLNIAHYLQRGRFCNRPWRGRNHARRRSFSGGILGDIRSCGPCRGSQRSSCCTSASWCRGCPLGMGQALGWGHWKMRVVMEISLPSMVVPQDVVMATTMPPVPTNLSSCDHWKPNIVIMPTHIIEVAGFIWYSVAVSMESSGLIWAKECYYYNECYNFNFEQFVPSVFTAIEYNNT